MQENLYDDQVFFKNYMELRENPVSYNTLLEQPALQAMLPPLAGKHVLDLGCGFGEGCAGYLRLGAAHVTGVDLSQNMINEAKKRNADERTAYFCMDMTQIASLGENYDVVASSLAVHYIEDFDALARSVYAILKKGGSFVFSQEHPLTTAPKEGPNWVYDEETHKRFYPLSSYSCPGPRTEEWLECSVHKYHRTFSQVLNALLGAGFVIRELREPVPDEQTVQKNPRMVKEYDKPSFLLIAVQKP